MSKKMTNFFKVPHDPLEDPKFLKLSASACKLYVILCKIGNYYADKEGWFFRSIEQLENDTKMGHATISRAKKELKDNHFIDVSRGYMHSTKNRSYDYYRINGYRFKK